MAEHEAEDKVTEDAADMSDGVVEGTTEAQDVVEEDERVAANIACDDESCWAEDDGDSADAGDTTDQDDEPSDVSTDEDESGGALWEDAPALGVAEASTRDPWVRVLLVTAMSLVVVLLVTTVAFYLYTNTLNHAPRTAAEHAIAKAEVAAVESPKNIGSWRDLAYAYAGAGRYDEALAAAAKGEKLDGGETLATVRGNILRMAGRHQEAIKAYDRAEVKVKELLERVRAERAKVGVGADPEDGFLFGVYYGRAEAKMALDDTSGAMKDYQLAAEEDPYQTDVWVALGQLYERAGKPDEARESYKEALKFVDDLKPAVEGLKRVGEGE